MEEKQRLSYKQCLTIALASVTLFVALMNFNAVVDTIFALFSYALPLFIGACIAFAINVPMKAFERLMAFLQRKLNLKVRHTFNTYVSLVLTFVCITTLVLAFANYMAPQIADSAVEIAEKAKKWYPDVLAFLNNMGIETASYEELLKDFELGKIFDFVMNNITINPEEIVDTVIDAASSTFSIAISAVSCIIFSIYMVTGKKKLNLQARKVIYAYTPKPFADKVCHIGSLFYKTFYNFISSQCLDAVILALLLSVAMWLFNMPYIGMICTITGVFALIPYIGAFIACAIGALLMLIVSPIKALIFIAVFLVVQQIEGQFIYPHLVGNSIGLPAIWTLFGALVGGEMMGVFGLLTFIPLTAVVYTLIKEGAHKRLKEKALVVECPVDTAEKEKKRLLLEKKQRKEVVKMEKKNKKKSAKEDKNSD